jgi:hypothetical protein
MEGGGTSVPPLVITENDFCRGRFVRNELGVRRIYLLHAHEALFALNTACAIVSFAFATSWEVYAPFARLEVRINHLLHIRQTDFIRGHFTFWIPALGLALCFWLVLRVASRAQLTRYLVRSVGGVAAFLLLPAVWICADPQRGRSLLSFYEVPPELAVVIVVFLLVLYRKWSISIWVGVAGAATHYIFWYWQVNGLRAPNWERPGYFGPLGPLVGSCSAIIWLLATRGSSRTAAKS